MFGNNKLKAEITRLESVVSVHRDRVEMLEILETRIDELKAMVSSLKSDVADRDKELSTLKKQLRKQNGADILVNAFEAVGIIPTNEKKDYHAEEKRLLNLQQQYSQGMQNASGQQSYNGSLFGLGSMF